MRGIIHTKMMKYLWPGLLAGGLLCRAVSAESLVTVTLPAQSAMGRVIPSDFGGLSFETGSEMPNKNRVPGYLFSATNTQLITLFRNAGIHNLRLGGGTVDGLKAAMPSRMAIDNVFAFAKAVGDLNVTYSLRLLNGDPVAEASTAHYIWEHYRPLVANFSIGNEPDWKSFHYPPFGRGTDPAITNYASYLSQWREFAAAITNAAPGATFVGPDTGAYDVSTYWRGKSWTQHFAGDERNSTVISAITQHYYVGGNPGLTTSAQAIDNMLSSAWVTTDYPWLFDHNIAAVVADGLPYRLTESNDYLSGITNASDAFASALWALDYMHWWAAHGCAGVDFHNKSWLRTDTVYLDSSGNYQVYPKAYALKAFDLGSHGHTITFATQNANGLNLTAYAVADADQTFVTLINKEHGSQARAATVTIEQTGRTISSADAMFLLSGSDAAAKNSITLGGGSITNNAPWRGQWAPLDNAVTHCTVSVPSASVAVVRISFNRS